MVDATEGAAVFVIGVVTAIVGATVYEFDGVATRVVGVPVGLPSEIAGAEVANVTVPVPVRATGVEVVPAMVGGDVKRITGMIDGRGNVGVLDGASETVMLWDIGTAEDNSIGALDCTNGPIGATTTVPGLLTIILGDDEGIAESATGNNVLSAVV